MYRYQLSTVRQYFHQNLSLQYIWTAHTSFPISPRTFFAPPPPQPTFQTKPPHKEDERSVAKSFDLVGGVGGGACG
jgi:hypothetical protein